MYLFIYVFIYLFIYLFFVFIYLYIYIYLFIYLCMLVCICMYYVCMYACVCICMYVRIIIYLCSQLSLHIIYSINITSIYFHILFLTVHDSWTFTFYKHVFKVLISALGSTPGKSAIIVTFSGSSYGFWARGGEERHGKPHTEITLQTLRTSQFYLAFPFISIF